MLAHLRCKIAGCSRASKLRAAQAMPTMPAAASAWPADDLAADSASGAGANARPAEGNRKLSAACAALVGSQ